MHIVVTGAGGFVGQALVRCLLNDAASTPTPLTRLTAIDQRFGPENSDWQGDARVSLHEGDFSDPALLDQALSTPPDVVFHLASVPGSLAEREQALGLRVNLMAPLALLERLAQDTRCQPKVVKVVFASSVAVYGALPTTGRVSEDCATHPQLAYGAHKRMTELLLADLTRQGRLDGVSLRLPGIVSRPLSPTGHGSAFMSDLIRQLMAGQAYDCPVSAAASAWWMSLPCCVANLLHAARLPASTPWHDRTVQLPVITATVAGVIAAIEAHTGLPADVRHSPNAVIETLFGRLPPLDTPQARALGFADDGTLAQLVQRALAD